MVSVWPPDLRECAADPRACIRTGEHLASTRSSKVL